MQYRIGGRHSNIHGSGATCALQARSREQSTYPRDGHIRFWAGYTPGNCVGAFSLRFLTFRQVLTGEYPFQNVKPQELSYHVVSGVRPDKPADAENIGILDPLWELMEKCWRGDKTRRPRIQEVMEGVGDAAADWHTEMPPGGTGQQEDSGIGEDSDELDRSKFRLSSYHVKCVLKSSVQLKYFNSM